MKLSVPCACSRQALWTASCTNSSPERTGRVGSPWNVPGFFIGFATGFVATADVNATVAGGMMELVLWPDMRYNTRKQLEGIVDGLGQC